MTMTIEKNLRDFDFWGNAASNAAKLTYDELDQLESQLEDMAEAGCEPYSITDVNDFMSFDFETVCDWLGLDYEEVMSRE